MAKNNLLPFCHLLQSVCYRTFLIGKTHRIASVSLLSLLPLVANAEALSLQQAVDKAINQDDWLISSQQKENAIRALAQGVTALPDPKINVGLLNMPTDSFDFNQEAMTQFSVSISQMFPAGDTLRLAGEKYATQGDQMPLMRDNRRAMLAMEVSNIWLTAYSYEESIKLVKQNRTLFEQLHEAVESGYSSAYGRAKQQDLVRSELELIKLDHRLTQLRQEKENALKKLSQYIFPKMVDHDASDQSITLKNAADPISGTSLNTLTSDALAAHLSQHPLVRIVDVQSNTAQIDKVIAEQKYKPEWGVTLGYGYRGDDLSGKSRADLASIAVSVSVPIFSSRRQDAQVKAASLQVESFISEKQLVLKELMAKYRVLTSDINLLDQRIRLYQTKLLPSYRESAQAMLNAYTSNDGVFSDVVQARIATLNAHIELLNISIERFKRLAELNYVMTQSEGVKLK
ncbi:TolC family protein [Marinomonas mediterranea]|jgi:Outer membrane protein|uniref:Outer membrane efflux protein n=1 Tax=Marinomonas mediterranea (strain ATCC 700492 / JCM 21426 / NBRC 103028 / MMB-1) TaxID=717774 RepID=F2JUB1_MARM1|nr:TolC family protein [Marinomonas mediterranea]ADZ92730.1 outer membrane efflux protein [Marinomonas mediterranea MMB-1]WCN10660.1 TolC family protein [Marinomonas mediterranea]WCN14717.1 TolC family protein [Marinomonas mediterranea]WCN18758.1 TolC family protein [Marinomonas mediterranea MMB-1]